MIIDIQHQSKGTTRARAARTHVLPALQHVQPGSTWTRVTAYLVMTMLAGCVAFGFVPWQQSLSGAGKVIALAPMERQQSIDAPIDGRIVRWHVSEGSRVRKGDRVVDMADLDPNLPSRLQQERTAAMERIRAISEREQHLAQRVVELEQSVRSEIVGAEFRIEQAQDRLRAAEQTLDAASAKVTVSTQNLKRHQELFPRGLVSRRSLEVAEAERDTADAELRRSKAQLNEARNMVRTLEAERARAVAAGSAVTRDARAGRESALAEIASARQAIQQVEVRLSRQSTQTIVAPVDGVIFRLAVQPDSGVVKTGEEIASIVPDVSSPVVELWVNGNDMPLISAQRKVRLQFEGWPAVQFVGWPSVAVGTFGGVVRLVDATNDGTGKFRVLVEPDASDQPWPEGRYLRQGVRTKGWVLLNTVPVAFEVWRQFNGFAPAVDKAPLDQAEKGGAGK